MARPDDARSDDRDGSVLGTLFDHLENRIIMLIAASLLGVTGNQILDEFKPTPDYRPDPWTGANARESHAEIREEIRKVAQELKATIEVLNAHLIRGEAGFYRISELERRVNQLERHNESH